MIKFAFLARCGDQTMPLEVSLEYQPGNQTQRARRMAVGDLMAKMDIDKAEVDASGTDMVTVTTDSETWVIGESYSGSGGRGNI